MNFATISRGLLRVYWKYREDRVSSQRALLERTIPNLVLHHNSANTVVQFTITSHLDYAPSIWFTPIHSWLTHSFPSVLSICHSWSCQRAIAFVDHSVSNAASSPLCLVISISLFTSQVNYAFLKKGCLNLWLHQKPFLYALLAICASSLWYFSQ